ncbi:MAG: hypothetical protein EAZ89_00940 [Bacteroidetes bacterium]|nr:MAG: hypothetical protein EAZ89_00940 [Bacteroidota bacterium]
MISSDQLFFFATNHGGGWHQVEDKNYSGVSDGNNDEGDPFFYDETLFYYNTPGAISDDQLSGWINSIPFARLVAVIEPCFGGGLLRDLKGSNRVIVSASTEFEFSWALPPSYQYNAFSYHFTAAVNGATHSGTPVDADSDNDGDVSILEAFLYATNADTQPETPQYEDSGDGQSTAAPSVSGTDGGYGATVGL